MAYSYDQWKERVTQRTDLSSSLVHLTRSATIDGKEHSAVDVLIKILKEGKLIGSNPRRGFITGNRSAVCFQDAPLSSIAENIAFEKKHYEGRNRYSGCGLIFSKYFVHAKGGRPVIYDKPSEAKRYITDQNEHWRIVSFDLSDTKNMVDWMHEREWRLPGDMTFDLKNTAVLIDKKDSYREFIEKCSELKEPKILESVCGLVVLSGLLM